MKPPAFKGGQGRTARDVKDDGSALAIGTAVLIGLALWCLIYYAVH